MDALTSPEPAPEPLDRPASPDRAPPQPPCRQVGEGDHGAETVGSPPSATTPPPPRQSEAGLSLLEEEEWEVRRILGKRWVEKGSEYKVRWKDTWLPRSQLANAQRLLQEFEARHRGHGGRNQSTYKRR